MFLLNIFSSPFLPGIVFLNVNLIATLIFFVRFFFAVIIIEFDWTVFFSLTDFCIVFNIVAAVFLSSPPLFYWLFTKFMQMTVF